MCIRDRIIKPQLILADEPTGALDSRASDELLNLFTQINQSGQTVLMVTHSVKAASSAKRVLFIKDGQVFHQIYRGCQTNEEMYQKITAALTVLTTGDVYKRQGLRENDKNHVPSEYITPCLSFPIFESYVSPSLLSIFYYYSFFRPASVV